MAEVIVLRGVSRPPEAPGGAEVVPFEEIRAAIVRHEIAHLLGRWEKARLLTHRLDTLTKPLNTALILRWLSRSRPLMEDEQGRVLEVGPGELARMAAAAMRDLLAARPMLRAVRREVRRLAATSLSPPAPAPGGPPLFLRTDLIWGLASGGSVGHIAGVLNNLGRFGPSPVFVTTDRIPTVSPQIETHVVLPDERFRDFNALPEFHYNRTLPGRVPGIMGGRRPGFIYQRYSRNNFTGVRLARDFGVPLALEYNGSEVWVQRNWVGRPLPHEDLTTTIERLDLSAAALVVVVSRVIGEELRGWGIDPGRILVNPNGVDPDRYSPQVDGSGVRRRHGLDGKMVIGFIGTFGRWHGAEILAEAFARLLQEHPGLDSCASLLMVGDGVTMPGVRAALEAGGVAGRAVLTGLVPQEEGPAHLAACDILVASHVPNPDGTPFFGSPTKLFEYMAMGRGIVASDLDQIGEVLEHGRTAWLVRPGDVRSLAGGLARLAQDPDLRARLGAAAREVAVARHSWREHTRRIVERLAEVTR